MKITIDLPDNLVWKLKRRAAHDRRKLKDLIAELLRRGLADLPPTEPLARPIITRDKETGLPLIQSGTIPRNREQLTPDRIADILLEQESE